MGIHDCKECYMVTEISEGVYECDCVLYGKCPLDEEPKEDM